MKQKKLILLFSIAAMFAAIAYCAFGYFTKSDTGITLAIGGVTAGVATEGMLGVDKAVEDAKAAGIEPIIDSEFEQEVIDMTPGVAPLDTMMRSIGRNRSTKVLDPKVFSIGYKPFEDIVVNPIESEDETSIYMKTGNQTLWSIGDTVIFDGMVGYDRDNNPTPGVPLWGYIYGVDPINGYIVQPINGKMNSGSEPTFDADIAANAVIYRGSKPGTESQLRTVPNYALPADDFNYIHKFMTQIEVTEWSEMHGKKVKWGFGEQSERALRDYRATKEIQYFRGVRKLFNSKDPNKNEPIRNCGGLMFYNPNYIDLTTDTAITDAKYVELTQRIFDGNNGSETRVMFCGSDFMTKMQNSQQFTKMLEAQKTELKGGVELLSIMTTYGKLLIKHHPLFSLMGWKNAAAVIDFQNLTELRFESFRRLPVNFTQLVEKQAKGLIVWEAVCPEFTNMKSHSFIVGPGGL